MTNAIGIRKEDKNRWERRVPLVPDHVAALASEESVSFAIQASDLRAFDDQAYRDAGAHVRADLAGVPVVVGVKEMPIDFFEEGGVYVFFSHTIKGQSGNMPMFRRLAERGCTLIDYERIVDASGRRLVFFGKWAGTAGMVDSLWALGKRLASEGIDTPLAALQQTWRYEDLAGAQEAISRAGETIARSGLPHPVAPLATAFLGYGNVSRGAQEMYDLLPVEVVEPGELEALSGRRTPPADRVFKVVFREGDLVVHRDRDNGFDLQDYYQFPENYRSVFSRYLPHLTAVMNCVYWDRRYPRFILQSDLAWLFSTRRQPRLRVLGDISCDVHGAMEVTVKTTEPDNPVYVIDPDTAEVRDGVEGRGVVVLAVDNLPCELPRESSASFSSSFRGFVPALASADFDVPFEALDLPPEIKAAVILHRGQLTQPFMYMRRFLKGGV